MSGQTPISPAKNFLAGGFGGMCLVIAGHPFDTIKVRLQTMSAPTNGMAPLYTGAFDCARKTLVNEGLRGFYKGMGTPIMMVTPNFALAFFGYGLGKTGISKLWPGEMTPIKMFFAGGFSGAMCTFLVCPVERIKCLLQIQAGSAPLPGQTVYAGPIDCGRQLLKTGGISSLYRGLGATFIRGIPQAGLYFMTYDVLKKAFAPADGTSLTPIRTLTAGGLTGIINWVFMLPADVIKSRIQTAPEGTYPKGFRDALRALLREDGPKGLFRGIVPVFVRAFPANAACFMGFEVAMKFLNWTAPSL
ncbi:mitochondrial carnitine/acylcarnitine carrier protein-like [Bradysia coprophila]|uniref:mitochondrial carnitine/acylcarnitine carrier protein-like n=1 Tax=Bradysia coprophila TaxID=38358 RepID=UPI00187D838D|nr:mitochondrial carnitine/acylcarnitine carrier protein-like [Bradysia coprophila]XP_037025336.1 mitochondrial carnitine/acylcarnitine carrier protein-like [Bradysia coprophila]XP_037025337.1 mitochondrial carnitine/acylcarnitine carrier protein-like [Bradysia coprophila]